MSNFFIFDVPNDGSCGVHSQILSVAMFVSNAEFLSEKLSNFNNLVSGLNENTNLTVQQNRNLYTRTYLNKLKDHFQDDQPSLQIIADFEKFFLGLIFKVNSIAMTNSDNTDSKKLIAFPFQFDAKVEETFLGYTSNPEFSFLNLGSQGECVLENPCHRVPGVFQFLKNLQSYEDEPYFKQLAQRQEISTAELKKQFQVIYNAYFHSDNSLAPLIEESCRTIYPYILKAHIFVSLELINKATHAYDLLSRTISGPSVVDQALTRYINHPNIKKICEHPETHGKNAYTVSSNLYLTNIDMRNFIKAVPEFNFLPAGVHYCNKLRHQRCIHWNLFVPKDFLNCFKPTVTEEHDNSATLEYLGPLLSKSFDAANFAQSLLFSPRSNNDHEDNSENSSSDIHYSRSNDPNSKGQTSTTK